MDDYDDDDHDGARLMRMIMTMMVMKTKDYIRMMIAVIRPCHVGSLLEPGV